ncbi:MAG: hypothetical protein FWF94_07305 [Oscillospiraceae bacterium]|nr:hypothetical protein [Oscillospiraceae bacterium]
MKKLALLLALCLVLTLAAGCEEGDNDPRAEERQSVSVDYDLTSYTAQIANATMLDMNENPEKYIGKTFKMKGTFLPVFVEEIDRDVNYIQVDDGCCMQYFEFKLKGENYPPEESDIEFTGVFGLYDEGDYTELIYLDVDNLSVI